MRKIFYAMAVLFGCNTVSFAQTSFIATLQHGGEFTHYYGAGALTTAYNAAENGDIITLSPGTFTSPGTINKGITLRGTGVEATEKTYISGETTIRSTDSTMVTTVEGIRFNAATKIENNATGAGQGTIKLIKNVFYELSATVAGTYSTDRGPTVRVYNCAINGSMTFNGNSYPDFLFYNSYVLNPHINSYRFSETTTTFINCMINWTSSEFIYYGSGRNDYLRASSCAYYLNFFNCIFNWTGAYGGTDTSYLLPNTATCYNCLSINKSTLFNNLVSGGNNWTADNAADVFVTYTNSVNEGETFELTDAAKEAYIGTDGTQIGMQGGNYPYTTTVQYPIVTKFNADSQTDKAGMLNIEVEVDGN